MVHQFSCASIYIDFLECMTNCWEIFMSGVYEEDKKVDLEEIVIDDYDRCDDFY